jgi:hypothetical protein
MDAFEDLMKKMKGMTAEQQAQWIAENKKVCICPTCPTHTNCAKKNEELLFCATGKSFMCISSEKGCMCPTCPVTKAIGLKYKSFCTRGAEKAQRYEHTIWGAKIP